MDSVRLNFSPTDFDNLPRSSLERAISSSFRARRLDLVPTPISSSFEMLLTRIKESTRLATTGTNHLGETPLIISYFWAHYSIVDLLTRGILVGLEVPSMRFMPLYWNS
jgi:hypothetical protein